MKKVKKKLIKLLWLRETADKTQKRPITGESEERKRKIDESRDGGRKGDKRGRVRTGEGGRELGEGERRVTVHLARILSFHMNLS